MTKAERFELLTNNQAIRGNLRAKSANAALFSGMAGIGDFAIRLGSTAILARLIVPEHFGLVMMVTAVIGVADQLKEMGLSAATVQQSHISHEEVTNLFWINVAASVAIALVTCACAPLISDYYREPRLTAITCVLASNFVFGGLLVQHQALLTRQLRLGRTSSIRLTAGVLSTGLAIFLAWLDYGYWALIWREVTRSALLAVGMWISFPWLPGLPFIKTNVRPLLGFGANLTAANVLAAVTGGVDRFFIGRTWGPAAVGVYRQAYQLIAAPTDQLLSPLYQVAHPALCLLQKDNLRFVRYYKFLLTIVCSITMPLSLFVAVHSTEITLLLLGEKWIDCAPIIMILSFATFAKQSVGSAALILIAQGRAHVHFFLSVLCNVTFVIGVIVGVRWGITGVAVADVVVTYVLIAPRVYFSLKHSPVAFGDFTAAIIRPAISSIMMAFVLLVVHEQSNVEGAFVQLAVGTLIAPIAFFGCWRFLPGGSKELASLLSNLLSALKRKSASVTLEQPAVPVTH